jgi:hypothetical protein
MAKGDLPVSNQKMADLDNCEASSVRAENLASEQNLSTPFAAYHQMRSSASLCFYRQAFFVSLAPVASGGPGPRSSTIAKMRNVPLFRLLASI